MGLFRSSVFSERIAPVVMTEVKLGYWCAVDKQGQGFMTEAGLAVIEFGFAKLGLHRLVVWHHLENERSQRLIERLGFSLIGVEHEAFMKNGRWIDTKMYELL